MKKALILLLFCTACVSKKNKTNYNFTTTFEKSQGTETATYSEIINYYTQLAESYPEISIDTIGKTDSGEPLHMVTLNMDGEFKFSEIQKNKSIILINNGIHPGEPDGIDATMMLFRDIVQEKINPPKNTVLVSIPVYNVGGCLNRNATTRTNQNGPKEYGFRGNARNFDLNRDFIKSDTKNARSFAKIFHLVDPDIFIDNHVSNGADYQYTLTHLFTQHNKLGGELGNFLHKEITPLLTQKLNSKNWDITPYVNVFNQTPENGFNQFMDSPRYSTGYTSLFNTFGMMVETHMLKPYKPRVEGTYEILKSMLEISETHGYKIKALRKNYHQKILANKVYNLNWEIDTTKTTTLKFKGFEASKIPSKITGKERLKFDNTKPYTKEIPYQNYYKPADTITIPNAYVIPKSWWQVIDLLKQNKVALKALEKDSIINVEAYLIDSYKTRNEAYEGHYPHFNTKVKSTYKKVAFRKGDYLVITNQKAIRYLLETLEPEAPDSFFNWNFFDTILQQKEGFSPYVWEDKANMLLAQNPKLQIAFNIKKSYNPDFANNWYAQLDWLHKQSENYEKAHLQYPVYRILN